MTIESIDSSNMFTESNHFEGERLYFFQKIVKITLSLLQDCTFDVNVKEDAEKVIGKTFS